MRLTHATEHLGHDILHVLQNDGIVRSSKSAIESWVETSIEWLDLLIQMVVGLKLLVLLVVSDMATCCEPAGGC